MPPNLVLYAIPAFVLLLAIEAWIAVRENHDWMEAKDSFSSMAMGIGNVLTGFFTKTFIVLATYMLMWEFRIMELDPTKWWFWVILFFADDFSYYWFHRFSHTVRFLWASHVVHHSSQKYNLATALRQTWTGNIAGSFIFWAWMPLVGFHPVWVMMMQGISLIYQFWIHTEAIHKLPRPIEFIFNTPSHHRVHHASDLKYLDKNHAGILIIWDRMFGTFQKEEEHPTYGLTTNIKSYNPFVIAFHEWISIGKDVWKAGSVKNALGYLFGPPGWSHDGSRKTTRQLRAEATAPLTKDTHQSHIPEAAPQRSSFETQGT